MEHQRSGWGKMKFVDARSAEQQRASRPTLFTATAAAASATPAAGATSGFDAYGACTLQGLQGGAAPAYHPLSAAGAASSLPMPLSDNSAQLSQDLLLSSLASKKASLVPPPAAATAAAAAAPTLPAAPARGAAAAPPWAGRTEVRRVAPADAAAAAAALSSPEPLVLTGRLDGWGARRWTPGTLASEFGAAELCVRLHPRAVGAVWESECVQQAATVGEFCRWLEEEAGVEEAPQAEADADAGAAAMAAMEVEDEGGAKAKAGGGGLADTPRRAFVGYADYQDMHQLFAAAPAALAAVDWSALGAARGGEHSSLWLGSEGAHTPTHFDTYGVNLVTRLHELAASHGTRMAHAWHTHRTRTAHACLVQVAQLHGRKQWTLYPPGSTSVRPSRVPYEESSVFSEEPGKVGGGAAAEGGAGAAEGEGKGALRVVLNPGEVLLVPRHWWHRVETLSHSSLSVNTWLDAPTDPADRVKEALVRMVACALMSADDVSTAGAGAGLGAGAGTTAAWWLNPTEEAWAHADSIEALRAALRDAAPPGDAPPRDVETRDVVNALCTGDALDEAAAELCRRATLPSAPRALRGGGSGSGGGGGGGGRHAARVVEAERARSAVASECATMARRFCAAGVIL